MTLRGVYLRKFLGKKELCKFLRNYLQKKLGPQIFAQIFLQIFVQIFGKKIFAQIFAEKIAKQLAQIFYGSYLPKTCCVIVTGWEVSVVLREVRENFATSSFLLLFHLLQRRVCLMARILSPPKIEKDNNTKYEIETQEKSQ